jgi:diguanylate cyclase (GGDEF)-like protein
VRIVVALVALLPMVAVGLLAGSRLDDASTIRRQADLIADQAGRLQAVARARVQLNLITVPLEVVVSAFNVGADTAVLDEILQPEVPYGEQLTQVTDLIASFPALQSPALRADVAELSRVNQRVVANTITFAEVQAFMTKMQTDIDNLWNEMFDRLQGDISDGRSPGSFGLQASTLNQTYQAFVSGSQLVGTAGAVLYGAADPASELALFEAQGVYQQSVSLFSGHLDTRAQAAWHALQAEPGNQAFAETIQQAINVALDNRPSPFADDRPGLGAAMARGLDFFTDLNTLVTAASQDLQDSALAQASAANDEFEQIATVLAVLAVVVVGGVLVAAQSLVRPLRRLAASAQLIHDGNFDPDHVAETGPRETLAAALAFNEMASTLKGVERRAVALATEDFSHPDLFVPLPGRTGQALQVSIDTLAARIREGERQRVILYEEATHDKATGLLNRAAVMDYLTNDVARRRQAGEAVAVLFLDLDGLKHLNDTYGHDFGDEAINATAAAILDSTDICDIVGRLGGDEFLVVLCHNHSGDGDTVAARINTSLSRRSLADGEQPIRLNASVGIALARCDADTDPLSLVRQADEAMYIAKRTARALVALP